MRSREPSLAVQLCSEAHDAGCLQCYALPSLAAGDPPPGLALGNVLDLRGCGLELAATALLTWLVRCAQMRGAGVTVHDQWVKLITGGQRMVRAEQRRDEFGDGSKRSSFH